MLEPIGDPARTIERMAVKGGFDTIVIGSRGLGAVTRTLVAASPSTSRPTAADGRRRPLSPGRAR